MKFFLHFLGAFALVAVVYADFISDLTGHHFQVLTPGSSGYAAASASRTFRHLLPHSQTSHILMLRQSSIFVPARGYHLPKVRSRCFDYPLPLHKVQPQSRRP